MIDSFSEAEKLLLVFDILPKFSDLIVFTILSSHLGGQYTLKLIANNVIVSDEYLERLNKTHLVPGR